MSKSMDVALKAAEQQVERESTGRFSYRMNLSARDVGRTGSLRHTILSMVAAERYEEALEDLLAFPAAKKDFAEFVIRSDRYFKYSVDLINAIKAKRGFPGLKHLSMSKQQELYDKATEHFEDLKATLRKIENIEQEVRLDDVRSTVWVVKALMFSVFALLVIGFLREISRGVLPGLAALGDDLFGQFVNWLFDLTGL